MIPRRSVDAGGTEISFLSAGGGPPVVLLHGIGGNATQFRHQLDGLAGAWTVVAWDAPGYGDSGEASESWLMADYAAVLAAFLDALDLGRVRLLGQSWGGVLAQTFVGRYPERVDALILSDTSMGGRSQPDEERLASLNARLSALETQTPAQMAAARTPAVLGPNPAAETSREVEAMLAQIRPAGYRQAAIALAEADTRAIHATIRVPTLIVAGEHDTIVPPTTAAALRAAIPGAQLITIPNTGHLSGQEDPDAYNTTLHAFLKHIDPR